MTDQIMPPFAGRTRRRRVAVTAVTALGVLTTGGVASAATKQQLIDEASRESDRPAAQLSIADRETLRFRHSGRTLDVAKVVDREGHAYRVALDERDRSVDLATAERDEAVARRQRFGKLEPSLAGEVSSASTGDRLPVSIWVAGTPAVRRTGNLSQDLEEVRLGMAQQRSRLLRTVKTMDASASESVYGPAVFAELKPGQIRKLEARGDVNTIYRGTESNTLHADDASTTHRFHSVWTAGNLGFSTSARPVVHESDGVADTNGFLNNATHPVTYFCAAVNSICNLGKNFGTTSSTNHATRVAGQIASTHPTARGVAPSAQQILSANSQDLNNDTKNVAANEWARGNGGDPTNLSWGQLCPDGNQNFMQRYLDWATRNLFQTFTLSSGNDHSACPGNFRVAAQGAAWSVITVGAINDKNTGFSNDDAMSGFSRYLDPNGTGQSSQDKPEVVAVGENTMTTDVAAATVDGIAGTSFAAPLIAGQVTSMLARQPGQNQWPETNKAAVIASAVRDVDTTSSDKDGQGAVLMNLSDDTYRFGRFHNLAGGGGSPLTPAAFTLTDTDGKKYIERTASLTAGQQVKVAMAYDSHSTGGSGTDKLGADLDLRVMRPDGTTFVCSGASTSNAWESCSFTAPVSGAYRLRVRLFSNDADWLGSFIGLAWSVRSVPNVCSAPAKSFPAAGGTLAATNQNGPTYFDSYSGWAPNQTGREQVFKYVNTATRNLTFTDTSSTMDLHAVQIANCAAEPISPSVRGHGTNSLTLTAAPAGTYYFIGDSANGAVATSTYKLTVG